MEGILGQLGVNWRLLLTQGVNFFVLLVVLNIFVFKPLTKIIEERRKRIEFGLKGAEEAEKKLNEIEVVKTERLAKADKTALGIISSAEDEAKKRDPAPVELFITGDGHIKKLNVVDKVVVGGLSFTVKEQCDLKLKGMKIKIQSGATLGSKQELIELLTSIL